eukprot:SAG11_NODE_644_length_7980_cov_112.535963_3_plen_152_part_00
MLVGSVGELVGSVGVLGGAKKKRMGGGGAWHTAERAEMAGEATGVATDCAMVRVAELRRLVVLPAWRRCGVGSALLEHAERYLTGRYERCNLYVSRRLELAHHFFAKRGYDVLESFDNEWQTDKLQKLLPVPKESTVAAVATVATGLERVW